ncbi:MAG: polysaccharide biosynthesis C-terminal domain-containing protein [Ignavibacteriales bacterium]|nr:polysaccharide biosynthesis C-terminal domain-containing protein [Ignavibacteriales bacterium]
MFSKTLTYYTFILILVGLGISFFSKELIEILAKKQEYWESYSVIPIISLAFVLKGIQYIYSLSFHYSKRTSYNAAIVIISSLLNVALNIVLVDEFSYIGAAYAILIATLFMMWLSYHYGQRFII